jgi:Tfp pilus assembly protein PilO
MKKIVLISIFFAGFLFGGVLLVDPLLKDYKIKRERNDILKQEFENLENYIEEIEKVGEKIEENKEVLEAIKTAFPEDHDAPALFLYLEDTMSKSNLDRSGEMGSFSSKAYSPNEIDHKRIKEVSFSIGATGQYQGVKEFFVSLEKSIRLIKPNSISISQATDTDDPFGLPAEGSSEDSSGEETATDRSGFLKVKIEANTYSY